MAEVTLEIHGIRVVLVDEKRNVDSLISHALVALKQMQQDYREINYPFSAKVACVTTENKVDEFPPRD